MFNGDVPIKIRRGAAGRAAGKRGGRRPRDLDVRGSGGCVPAKRRDVHASHRPEDAANNRMGRLAHNMSDTELLTTNERDFKLDYLLGEVGLMKSCFS